MIRRQPPMLRPGPLTRADADAMNQFIRDLAVLLGGFDSSPPLTHKQDSAGVSYGMNVVALARQSDFLATLASIGVLTVEAADGSPSYGSSWKIQLDETDGFSMTQPATGVVRIDLACYVRVSATDTTPDYLVNQITGDGYDVTVTRMNAGANEYLKISVTDLRNYIRREAFWRGG